MSEQHTFAIIVMGVSGCGKSSVGRRLAQLFGCPFIEGDELHPASNVRKMSGGIALTDEDRRPWLDLIHSEIVKAVDEQQAIVVSCSALRRVYRDRLRHGLERRVQFVFLDGRRELLEARMIAREGHFMPAALLASQFATLENPSGEIGVITIIIDNDLETIVHEAAAKLRQNSP